MATPDVCVEPDCTNPPGKKKAGRCNRCYRLKRDTTYAQRLERWNAKRGSGEARAAYEKERTPTCPYCERTWTRTEYEMRWRKKAPRFQFCPSCRERGVGSGEPARGPLPRARCPDGTCGSCPDCRRADHGYRNRAVRAARKRGQRAERVSRRLVFERDQWTCQICQRELSQQDKFPHPRSLTIDHIWPLSRGGEHRYDNVQTACLECNLKKSDKILIGARAVRVPERFLARGQGG